MKIRLLCGAVVQVLGFILAFSPAALGQSSILGSISGTVTDTTGAAIPHAIVEVVNVDTGAKRTTRTQDNGYYILPDMLAGKYSLNISAPHFKTYVQEGFQLLVNEPQTINAKMQLGPESVSITVTTQPSPLNSVNATVSTTVMNAEVNDLPLDGRHFTQLLELSPGVNVRFLRRAIMDVIPDPSQMEAEEPETAEPETLDETENGAAKGG